MIKRKEEQLCHQKMMLRFKEGQIARMSGKLPKSDSKLEINEDPEKEELRNEIALLKQSLEQQNPDVIQVKLGFIDQKYAFQVEQLQAQLEKLKDHQKTVRELDMERVKVLRLTKESTEKILEYNESKQALEAELSALRNNDWNRRVVSDLEECKIKMARLEDERRRMINTISVNDSR